ncbi:MAG: FGGY family carbohydrate kinase [Flavisolibacter sp.]
MQPYVIGIDLGTGSIKAVAMDTQQNVLATTQNHYEVISERPGYFEQDPQAIWQSFSQSLRTLIDHLGPPALISLSSYMHGIMVVNEKCVPLTRLITWADMRSEEIAGLLRQSPDAENLYRATGAPIHAMLPLCKILWWQQYHPEFFKPGNKFISIKEFIWYQLFQVYEIDYSLAGATGLFHLQTHTWHKDSLKLAGLTPLQLSIPVGTNWMRHQVDPHASVYLGINEGTSFCIGSSDGCMAALGGGGLGNHTASLTLGTSGAVRLISSKPLFHFPQMIFNYILEENLYVCGGPVNNGGNVVQWALNLFWTKPTPTDQDYKEYFNSFDGMVAGSEGLLFLPYIFGERAPIWDEKAAGVFVGVRNYHTKAHFSKAVIEGICFNLNQVVALLAGQVSIQKIQISGGLKFSPVWLQILANISGKTICLGQGEDASARGAALLGMKSKGMIPDYPMENISDLNFIFPRQADHLSYQPLFKAFTQVYDCLKDSLHQLHDGQSVK